MGSQAGDTVKEKTVCSVHAVKTRGKQLICLEREEMFYLQGNALGNVEQSRNLPHA